MSDRRTPKSRLLGAMAALLLLLVAFAPALLLGESISTAGLFATGGVLLGVGLLARSRRGEVAHAFGTIVVVMGALVLATSVALVVLLVGGLGRGI